MACCLLVPCAPMSIVCPLPSCYLIIVSVAPAVSPSLPSFVSLYSLLLQSCADPLSFMCRTLRECFRLTVLQFYACLPACLPACLLVFPLRGGFCSSLFYFIIKNNYLSAFESSTSSFVTVMSLWIRILKQCFCIVWEVAYLTHIFRRALCVLTCVGPYEMYIFFQIPFYVFLKFSFLYFNISGLLFNG